MKTITLFSLLFSALVSTASFAGKEEIDFNSLVPADGYTVSESAESCGDDHHHDRYRCFASNRRGRRFEGEGRNPRWAQEKAMMNCRRYSHERYPRCRPLGCHRD